MYDLISCIYDTNVWTERCLDTSSKHQGWFGLTWRIWKQTQLNQPKTFPDMTQTWKYSRSVNVSWGNLNVSHVRRTQVCGITDVYCNERQQSSMRLFLETKPGRSLTPRSTCLILEDSRTLQVQTVSASACVVACAQRKPQITVFLTPGRSLGGYPTSPPHHTDLIIGFLGLQSLALRGVTVRAVVFTVVVRCFGVRHDQQLLDVTLGEADRKGCHQLVGRPWSQVHGSRLCFGGLKCTTKVRNGI